MRLPDIQTTSSESVVERVVGHLTTNAIRSKGLAGWISNDEMRGAQLGICGPTLYAGTAGIGLALAEYAAHAQDERVREVARGALRHALTRADSIPPEVRHGFYGGWAGIVYAAVRAANTLGGDDELAHHARQLLDRLTAQEFSVEFDVMSGAAGTVAALSLAHTALGDASIDLARSAAERLRDVARRPTSGAGLSWFSPGFGELPLTGFAHGSSGVGWALLELWRVTGEDWLHDLASSAFEYERHLFDERHGNWPDLRYYSTWRAVELLEPPFQSVWCHGAGGIGLVRLRCYELTGQASFRTEATRAAATLKASLQLHSVASDDDLGLCHGQTGRLELLRVLATGLRDAELLAMVELESDRLACRLCDVENGVDLMQLGAGLMLGKAGIGWFFARRIFPGLATPLLPSAI